MLKRTLVDPRPHLKAWVERMNAPQPGAGEFLANDEIPATLQPLFDALFGEFWPMLVGIRDELQRALPTLSPQRKRLPRRSEEHTSELQSLMRISYAVFCLKKKKFVKLNTSTL